MSRNPRREGQSQSTGWKVDDLCHGKEGRFSGPPRSQWKIPSPDVTAPFFQVLAPRVPTRGMPNIKSPSCVGVFVGSSRVASTLGFGQNCSNLYSINYPDWVVLLKATLRRLRFGTRTWCANQRTQNPEEDRLCIGTCQDPSVDHLVGRLPYQN